MSRRPSLAVLSAPLLAVAGLLASCGDDTPDGSTEESGLHVVVTHSILGDIVRNVIGEQASVEVVIPTGADPHEFQPSAQQVEAITEADLVVANGFAFEEGLLDALDAAADAGATVFEMASAFAPDDDHADDDDHAADNFDHADDDDHAADDDDHDGEDPHIWFDPVRMATVVEALGHELAALDPAGGFDERAAAYADEIRATDAEVDELLAVVPPARRKLVTNHEALGYFAERYRFEIVGTAIPSLTTAAASSAANLAELAAAIDAHGVPAVFADVSSPDELARALADEAATDVEVVHLLTETLAAPGQDGDDYLGLLLLDARRIADALA